ncbi:MAG TPA: hypothetical protein PKX15_02105 [Bacteroidales bacterium]|nr:hypothetical protein [Bacteroidales bacterium]
MNNIHKNPIVVFEYLDESTGKYIVQELSLYAANAKVIKGIEVLDDGKVVDRTFNRDKVRSLKLLTYNTKYLESDTEYWQKKKT